MIAEETSRPPGWGLWRPRGAQRCAKRDESILFCWCCGHVPIL